MAALLLLTGCTTLQPLPPPNPNGARAIVLQTRCLMFCRVIVVQSAAVAAPQDTDTKADP